MNKKRLLIFVVTYNAERTVQSVLTRIPPEVFRDDLFNADILVIDDGSRDGTFHAGLDYVEQFPTCPLTVLQNPVNLGYGGNQKVGYRYACDQGYDAVALLHGDGQYAPEELVRLVSPVIRGECDAVLGSRMMQGWRALREGMPLYKFVGNRILTWIENRLVGTDLSEYHSGYRVYSTEALRRVPFERNSDDFDFDTEIIIQLSASNHRIVEMTIPTFYGDEICYVNGLRYAAQVVRASLSFKIQRLGILYDPRFDFQNAVAQYQSKFDFLSSHSLALAAINPEDQVLIAGCGPGDLVRPFYEKAKQVDVIDQQLDAALSGVCEGAWQADLDAMSLGELTEVRRYTKVLALDVIEHLRSPERFLDLVRATPSCDGAELIVTTGNVAFLPVRLMLMLGSFNYGRRGILDVTHTRLFTAASLRRSLRQSGYRLLEFRGIPAPYPLALGRSWLSDLVLTINDWACRLLPGIFAYQLFVRARPVPTAGRLLRHAIEHSEVERSVRGGARQSSEDGVRAFAGAEETVNEVVGMVPSQRGSTNRNTGLFRLARPDSWHASHP